MLSHHRLARLLLAVCLAAAGASSVAGAKVCLNMVVKDAAAVIKPTLESVADHLSGWVICDLGSTDGTQDIVQEVFKEEEVKGILVQHEWKDFGTNRNMCLDAARAWSAEQGSACEHFFFMEAGEKLVLFDENEEETLKGGFLEEPAYKLEERYGPNSRYSYDNVRLLAAGGEGLAWRWIGTVQGFLQQNSSALVQQGATVRAPQKLFTMISHIEQPAQGAASLQYYEQTLTMNVEVNPANARSWFLLGNMKRAQGDKDGAIAAYLRRIELGGWAEQVFASAISLAQMLEEALAHNETLTQDLSQHIRGFAGRVAFPDDPGRALLIDAYAAAMTVLPYRKEPYYHLARLYRTWLGDHNACYAWSAAGTAMGDPLDVPARGDVATTGSTALYVDTEVYGWRLADELCTCAMKVDRYSEGSYACSSARDHLDHLVEVVMKPQRVAVPPELVQALARLRAHSKWYERMLRPQRCRLINGKEVCEPMPDAEGDEAEDSSASQQLESGKGTAGGDDDDEYLI